MKFDISLVEALEQEMLEIFLEMHGHTCDKYGVKVGVHYTENSVLKAEYTQEGLNLYGKRPIHIYRGLHLFLGEILKGNTKGFVIEEQIFFEETGVMLDCSRNGAASMNMLKKFVILCAACGINQLYLYMEDVYEIPENPYFGAFRGKYTYEELKELDTYGNKAGVELIPCIQTLAHLHTYLRWPETKSLHDTEDILLVGTKETEEFVRRMIVNASRPFATKKIHVGMDEADFLGLGQYLRDNGYQERYGIMKKHLDLILKICQENGLEAMMWSDMFFRLKSPTGDYYDLSEDTEFENLEKLPENLTLVYWDYYHHNKTEYDKTICLHNKISHNLRFAGGGWTWNGISPNYRKAAKTLKEGLASCKDQGIRRALCTFWFDNGTETPISTSLYSLLYFAELCYQKEVKKESMDVWLSLLSGYKTEAFVLLDSFDSPAGILPDNENADNPSKFILYQDVLMGLFDAQIRGLELEKHYAGLAKRLEELIAGGEESLMKTVFKYYQVLAEVLTVKSVLGIKLYDAYHSDNREEMKKLWKTAEKCIQNVEKLKDLRENIWMEECRVFGFEVLDIRIGGVITRMESAGKRVKAYIDGKIPYLEELEENRILYSNDKMHEDHRLTACGAWQNIVSAGNIAGI